MKYFKLYLITCTICCINFKQLNSEIIEYCDLINVPACLNKPHILCNEENNQHYWLDDNTKNIILITLNNFRWRLTQTKAICNLPMFKWSNNLEDLAEVAFKRDYRHYCCITNNFKNIQTFLMEFNAADSYIDNTIEFDEFRGIVEQIFINLTNSAMSPNDHRHHLSNTWLYSAYSNAIGCSYKCSLNMHDCMIICMMNGIELKYANQSFGYNQACMTPSHNFEQQKCDSAVYNCKNRNHLVCHIAKEFFNANLVKITYTTVKFILSKLDEEHKQIAWGYDLQHLAELITAHKLTDHDICIALDRFMGLRSIHVRGRKFFTETVSNIDGIWNKTDFDGIDGQMGCALFDVAYANYSVFNIYCLYFNLIKHKSKPLHASTHIKWAWLIYTTLALFVTVVIQLLLLCSLNIYIRVIDSNRMVSNEPEYNRLLEES